jgi:hypothetical protein
MRNVSLHFSTLLNNSPAAQSTLIKLRIEQYLSGRRQPTRRNNALYVPIRTVCAYRDITRATSAPGMRLMTAIAADSFPLGPYLKTQDGMGWD